MAEFAFRTVPHITGGLGASARLAAVLGADAAPVERALVVTDAGVRDLGLATPALEGLAEAGIDATVFADVVADPPEATIRTAADAARSAGAQAIIGFGGGSPMDTAKVAAALAASDQPLEAMYGVDRVTGPRLPLVLVPTTAGTGSEVTPIAVVTTGDAAKAGISAPVLFADAAVLDPALTVGLPPAITAYTGVDAMVHAIEAYTSRLKKNPLSDAAAVTALRLLFAALDRAMTDGGDLDARADMLIGAMLAGQAFANAPVGGVHAMAYPLGGTFHAPHGLSNAVVLTKVLEFNARDAGDLYAELAVAIGRPARASALIDALAETLDRCAITPSLSQFGVSHNHLPKMAEEVAANGRLLPNNPRPISYDDALRLYESML